MRSLFIITFLLLTSSVLEAQWIPRYTYHDENKQHLKEIFHVRDTLNNILEGPYHSYYLNGNLESKGKFSNNETVGVWEFFYETGKLKMRGALKNNSNYGNWEYFFENGNKQMEGKIINRKREGPWKLYYESGELKSEGSFNENKRSGLWKTYFEDGKLKGQIEYTADKGKYIEYYHTGEKKAEGPKSGTNNTGLWKFYNKDGSLQTEGYFSNNKRVGEWTFYHPDGSISSKGSYSNDQPDKEWIYYYSSGEISSKGEFKEGEKIGTWNAFFLGGKIKSTTTYNKDEGVFSEYYDNGNIKVKGKLLDGVKHGEWKYYYMDGSLEGEINFDHGRGIYKGYYPDGTLQSKGLIENEQRVGTWELYDQTGSLKGYHNIFYENDSLNIDEIIKVQEAKPVIKREYGVADYGFKKRKFNYFKSKVNEFEGIILSVNPLMTFIGWFPVGAEFYHQERLGHELLIEGIRDPFYTANNRVSLNDIYTRGYKISVRQKFYNPDNNFGLWYFGHSISYADLSHFVNTKEINSEDIITTSAAEFKVVYSWIIGYRLMQETRDKGFTADGYLGIGTGYRNFKLEDIETDRFNTLPKNKVPLDFNFGITFGMVYPMKKRK